MGRTNVGTGARGRRWVVVALLAVMSVLAGTITTIAPAEAVTFPTVKASVVDPADARPRAGDTLVISATAANLVQPSFSVSLGDQTVDGVRTVYPDPDNDKAVQLHVPLTSFGYATYTLLVGAGDENRSASPVKVTFTKRKIPAILSLVGDTSVPVSRPIVVKVSPDRATSIAPTRTVTVWVNGAPRDLTPAADGTVRIDTKDMSAGQYTVEAAYSGDDNWAAATRTTLGTVNLTNIPTATDLQVPSEAAGGVPFSARLRTTSTVGDVSHPQGTTVTIYARKGSGSESQIATGTTSDGAWSTISLNHWTAANTGTWTLRAVSSVNGKYLSSSSAGQSVTIVPAKSTVISLLPDEFWASTVGGRPIRMTATVKVADGSDPNGSVTFYDEENDRTETVAVTPTTESGARVGKAGFTLPATRAGDLAVSAYYQSTSQLPSDTFETFSFAKAPTRVVVPPTASVEADQTVEVRVEATDGLSYVPTGRIVVTENGQPRGQANLVDGVGDFVVSGLSLGEHTLRFSYGNDNDANAEGSSATGTITVTPARPTTTTTVTVGETRLPVQASPRPSATIEVAVPGGVPNGQVRITVDGEFLRSQSVTTSLPITVDDLPVDSLGSHSITADYVPAGFQKPSNGGASYDVVEADTTTQVTAPQGPVKPGDELHVEVTATGSSLVPSLDVQVTEDGSPVGQPVKLTNGAGDFTLPALPVGAHTLTFTYPGGDRTTSSSDTATVTVPDRATTTTVVLDRDQAAVYGTKPQAATFTVANTDKTAPTGRLEISLDGELVDTKTVSERARTFTVSNLPTNSLRTYQVSAEFIPSNGYQASYGAASYQVVPADTKITTVTPPSGPAVAGAQFEVVVEAPDSSAELQAVVKVHEGGQQIGEPVTLTDGVGRFTLPVLPVGSHQLDFQYVGETNTNPSPVVTVPVEVPDAATETRLTLSDPDARAVYLGDHPLTATATVSFGGAPVTDGQVRFTVGSGPGAWVSDPVGVVDGVASTELPSDELGDFDVVAEFTDPGWLDSSRDAGSYLVVKAESSIEVEDLGGPIGTGGSVGVTVHATDSSAVPSGTVTVTGADLEDPTFTVHPDGQGNAVGALALAGLSPGRHQLTFTYGGDDFVEPSSGEGSVDIDLDLVGTTTSYELSNPTESPAGGAPVELTVTVEADDGSAPDGWLRLDVEGEDLEIESEKVRVGVDPVTIELPSDVLGDHWLTVTYEGNETQAESSTEQFTWTVYVADSTTEVTEPDGPLGTDESLLVTVDAVDSSLQPTGWVDVSGEDVTDTVELRPSEVDGQAVAEFPLRDLDARTYDLTFTYRSEDDRIGASHDTVGVEVYSPSTTALSLGENAESALVGGDAVEATATVEVTDGSAPTGHVSFYVDGHLSESVLAAESVTVDLPVDEVGQHQVLVRFEGNQTQGTSDTTATYEVVKATTATAVAEPQGPVEAGAVLPVTVTVQEGSSVAPTKDVVVTEGENVVGDEVGLTAVEGEPGVFAGELVLPALAPGEHDLVFTYPGDRNTGESSDGVTVVVEIAEDAVPTHTELSLSDNADGAVVGGDPVVATVTVAVDDESAPVGEVDVTVDGVRVQKVDVGAGEVTVDLPVDVVKDAREVVAQFLPTVGTQAVSTSQLSTYAVVKAATEIELTLPVVPVTAADAIGVRVKALRSQLVPEGSVLVSGSGEAEEIVLDDGVATYLLEGLSLGSHDLTFEYVPAGPMDAAEPVVETVVIEAPGEELAETETVLSLGGNAGGAVVGGDPVVATAEVSADGEPVSDGRVRFTVAAGTEHEWVSEPVDVVGGAASADLPVGTVGDFTVTAAFGETDQLAGSSSQELAYTVVKAATETEVTEPQGPVAAGAKVPVTVTVQEGSSVVPTEDVVVTEGEDVLDEHVTLTAVEGETGVFAGEFTLPALAAGQHDLVFTYPGDATTRTSSTGEVRVTVEEPQVEPAETVTELTLSDDAAGATVGGDPVVASAGVSVDGEPVSDGRVRFTVAAGTEHEWVSEPVDVVGGEASADLPVGTVGDFTVVAAFGGADGLETSSSEELSYTVVKAATLTAVQDPEGPVAAGAKVPVTVTVQEGSSVAPTEDVVVTEGEDVLDEHVTLTAVEGEAGVFAGELALPALSAGEHTLVFTYPGDTRAKSSSDDATLVVEQPGEELAETETVLSLGGNADGAVVGGDPVVATAEVSADGEPVSDGRVRFTVAAGTEHEWVSEPVDVVGGAASADLPVGTVGDFTVVAAFGETGQLAGSSSQELVYTVVKAATETKLTEPQGPVAAGAKVPVTVTVQEGSPVAPTEDVVVTEGEDVLDEHVTLTAVEGEAGVFAGEFTLPALSAGQHDLVFTYPGDATTRSSSTGAVTVAVKQTAGSVQTTTTLAFTPDRPTIGGAKVSAVASVTGPAGEAPTDGAVAFEVDGWIKVVSIDGGRATIDGLAVDELGPVTVRATYLGTGTLNSSTVEGSYDVVRALTTTSVDVSDEPVGTSSALSVRVASTDSSVVPDGLVTVTGAGLEDPEVELHAEGKASVGAFPLAGLAPGEHELTFTYGGGEATLESSTTVMVLVKQTAGTAETSIDLAVPASAPVKGPKVDAVATVTTPAGQQANGWIAFWVDGQMSLQPVVDAAASVKLETGELGTVRVRAYYLGTGVLNASSQERTLEVVKAATKIEATTPQGEVDPGAVVPVTVTSQGSPVVPDGAVRVSESGNALGQVELSAGTAPGSAIGSLTVGAGWTPGPHTLDLAYAEGSTTRASTGQVTVVVKAPTAPPGKAVSTTSLTLDRDTTTVGGPAVTATATVAVTGGAAPDGQVSVVVDGAVVATKPAGAVPVAFALPVDRAGSHSVQVRYAGSATQAPSESAVRTYAVTEPVAAAAVASTVKAAFKKARKHRLKVTATVTSTQPVTGKIQVVQTVKVPGKKGKKGTTRQKVVGTATIKKVGNTVKAVITTKALTKGRQTLTVRYLGSPAVLAAARTYKVRVR